MKNYLILFITASFLVFTVGACSKKSTVPSRSTSKSTRSKTKSNNNDKSVAKAEDFDTFYDKFHKDLKFQNLRVQWPLKGYYEDHDGRVNWTKTNWSPMKVKIQEVDQSEFKTEYGMQGNKFVQKIWLPDSGYSSEYHFEKVGNEWYLTYARDTNF